MGVNPPRATERYMSAILALTALTLRQITGVRRLLVVGLLAALPVALTVVVALLGESPGDEPDSDFVTVAIAGLVVGIVLPIVSMALAAPAFGDDVEDGTLSFIALTPIPRWRIALAKFAAPVAVAAPVSAVSGLATTIVGLDDDVQASLAVGAGLLLGATAYSSIFAWAGLMTTRAISFGIVYVFLWELLAGALIPGVKYLSVTAYALTVMQRMGGESLSELADNAIGFPAALIGLAAVVTGFYALTVWRLRAMDVG